MFCLDGYDTERNNSKHNVLARNKDAVHPAFRRGLLDSHKLEYSKLMVWLPVNI